APRTEKTGEQGQKGALFDRDLHDADRTERGGFRGEIAEHGVRSPVVGDEVIVERGRERGEFLLHGDRLTALRRRGKRRAHRQGVHGGRRDRARSRRQRTSRRLTWPRRAAETPAPCRVSASATSSSSTRSMAPASRRSSSRGSAATIMPSISSGA